MYGTALAETPGHDAGLTASASINPAAIEAFGRSRLSRTKTDPTDARLHRPAGGVASRRRQPRIRRVRAEALRPPLT